MGLEIAVEDRVFTSSMALVMAPLPSATKPPIREIGLPPRDEGDSPDMENAYCPLRLALEYMPTGGGRGGTEPFPPQEAMKDADRMVSKNDRRSFILFSHVRGVFDHPVKQNCKSLKLVVPILTAWMLSESQRVSLAAEEVPQTVRMFTRENKPRNNNKVSRQK